jgi:hypothetical protein
MKLPWIQTSATSRDSKATRQDKAGDSKIMEEQSAEPVVLKQEGGTHYVFDPKGHVKKDLDVIVGIGEERSIQITASQD